MSVSTHPRTAAAFTCHPCFDEAARAMAGQRTGKGFMTLDKGDKVLTPAKAHGDWIAADKRFAKVLRLFKEHSEEGSIDACGNFFLLAVLVAIRVNASLTWPNSVCDELIALRRTGIL